MIRKHSFFCLAFLVTLFGMMGCARSLHGFGFTKAYKWIVGEETFTVVGVRSTDYTYDQGWDYWATLRALHAQLLAARALDFAYGEYLARYQHDAFKREFYRTRFAKVRQRVRRTGLPLDQGASMAIAFAGDDYGVPVGVLIRTSGAVQDLLAEELKTGDIEWVQSGDSREFQSLLSLDSRMAKFGPWVVARKLNRYVTSVLAVYMSKMIADPVDSLLVSFRGEGAMEEVYAKMGATTVAYLDHAHAVMWIPTGRDILGPFLLRPGYRTALEHAELFRLSHFVSTSLRYSREYVLPCGQRLLFSSSIEDAFMAWAAEKFPDFR